MREESRRGALEGEGRGHHHEGVAELISLVLLHVLFLLLVLVLARIRRPVEVAHAQSLVKDQPRGTVVVESLKSGRFIRGTTKTCRILNSLATGQNLKKIA